MATLLEAVLTRPNEVPERIFIDSELETLQELVGGYIEFVTHPLGVVIVNEEGLLHGMAINYDATRLVQEKFKYHRMGLVGPALILGPINAEGDLTSITDEVINHFVLGDNNED